MHRESVLTSACTGNWLEGFVAELRLHSMSPSRGMHEQYFPLGFGCELEDQDWGMGWERGLGGCPTGSRQLLDRFLTKASPPTYIVIYLSLGDRLLHSSPLGRMCPAYLLQVFFQATSPGYVTDQIQMQQNV